MNVSTIKLEKDSKIYESDYIYLINKDKPFDDVYCIISYNNGIISMISITSGKEKTLDIRNENLENLYLLHIPDYIRRRIGLKCIK